MDYRKLINEDPDARADLRKFLLENSIICMQENLNAEAMMGMMDLITRVTEPPNNTSAPTTPAPSPQLSVVPEPTKPISPSSNTSSPSSPSRRAMPFELPTEEKDDTAPKRQNHDNEDAFDN